MKTRTDYTLHTLLSAWTLGLRTSHSNVKYATTDVSVISQQLLAFLLVQLTFLKARNLYFYLEI